MVRILLTFSAALAACTPSPEEADMRSPNPAQGSDARGTSEAMANGRAPAAASPGGQSAGAREQAAQGPIAEPVSAAAKPAAARVDSPAEAQGRRILSTAFVMVGPDGHLTVELRDGRVLVLRDAVMRPKDYCGVQVRGDRPGAHYCGGYADVAAARPGGGPARDEAPSNATDELLGGTE